MSEEAAGLLVALAAAIPYAYVLSWAASKAYFKTKRDYQLSLLRQVGTQN